MKGERTVLSKVGKWLGLFKVEFDKHSPEILTGLGVTGMFASVIFSIQATPKVMKSIEEKKKELNKEKLTVGEAVEACWKHYIPTAITLATSTACVIGANSVNTRRNAALAAAYSISETALTEYRDKVKEIMGENKEKDIRADIERDKVNSDKPGTATQVEFVRSGDQLFKESISGRYFRSTREKVNRAELELQRMMLPTDPFDTTGGYVTMDDIYIALGLPTTGDDRVWYLKDGYITFDLIPVFTDDGDTCTVLTYGGRKPKPYMNC